MFKCLFIFKNFINTIKIITMTIIAITILTEMHVFGGEDKFT